MNIGLQKANTRAIIATKSGDPGGPNLIFSVLRDNPIN
jgi:hypothetical protein